MLPATTKKDCVGARLRLYPRDSSGFYCRYRQISAISLALLDPRTDRKFELYDVRLIWAGSSGAGHNLSRLDMGATRLTGETVSVEKPGVSHMSRILRILPPTCRNPRGAHAAGVSSFSSCELSVRSVGGPLIFVFANSGSCLRCRCVSFLQKKFNFSLTEIYATWRMFSGPESARVGLRGTWPRRTSGAEGRTRS